MKGIKGKKKTKYYGMRKNPNMRQILAILTDVEYTAIKRIASAQGFTMSQYVTQLLKHIVSTTEVRVITEKVLDNLNKNNG